jgi:aspartate-semialdehyde dehydrogenase
MSPKDVAVVGATGAVGQTMLRVLEQRRFPVARLVALASSRSAGKRVEFAGATIEVQDLAQFDFAGIDIGLFSAGASISVEHAPRAAAAGTVVVDNTSAFRMDEDVPLVVPEVNPQQIANRPRGIIANPNCSTIQMVVALAPLHRVSPIRRIVVSTYQSVSGAGAQAVKELERTSRQLLDGQQPEPGPKFPHVIGFNCLPQIDVFLDDGYTKEEHKMINETRKIIGDQSIMVSATCVRVPVMIGHSEAVNVETAAAIEPEVARELLKSAPGIEVVDNPARGEYPLQSTCAGNDPVYVGRLRRDPGNEHALDMWIAADNLLKGAALNAVQIAEIVAEEK